MVKIFRDILMFDQTFLELQFKRNVIIGNKHCIDELPHEFPYDLRLIILGKLLKN